LPIGGCSRSRQIAPGKARVPNFGPDGPTPGISPIDPDGPSIFTAIQEQLGLKRDAQRGPVDVLVIDRADRPSAD
jgi:uncharacterized protein (TIGR03435 family)